MPPTTLARAVLATFAVLTTLGAAFAGAAHAGPAGRWKQLTTAGPGARDGATLVYDPDAKRMLLFGGQTGSTYRNDVWQLSLGCDPSWSQITAPSPPAARTEHASVYDPVRKRLIVTGGGNAGIVSFGDTWALSLIGTPAWTKLDDFVIPNCPGPDNPGKPCPRRMHASVWSGGTSSLWLMGGYACLERQDSWSAVLADATLSWNLLAADPDCDNYYVTPGLPMFRVDHSLVYDAQNQRAVLFGGWYDPSVFNDTWVTNGAGNTWTRIADNPAGRMSHTAVYDGVNQRMVVFGGSDGQIAMNSTCELSLPANGTPAWTTLSPVGPLPPAYENHAAAFDPVGNRMIVFGTDGATWSLEFADQPPTAIADLVLTGTPMNNMQLRWTAPNDNAPKRHVTSYTVKKSTIPITEANFASATTLTGATGPSCMGGTDQCPAGALTSGLTYYFAVKSTDSFGNVSPLSNVASVCIIPGTPWRFCDEGAVLAQPVESDALEFALESPVPNPSRGTAEVGFALPSDAPASLEILDIAGRRVFTQAIAGTRRGRVTVAAERPLRPGQYVVRLRQNDRTASRPLVILP